MSLCGTGKNAGFMNKQMGMINMVTTKTTDKKKGLEKEEEEKVRTPTLRKKAAMKSTEGKQHEGANQTHISASGHVMCLMIMQSKQRQNYYNLSSEDQNKKNTARLASD